MADYPSTLGDLLNHLGELPGNIPVTIEIHGQDEKWLFQTEDLKNILMGILIEVPALRKALDEAHGDIETLQEQIASKVVIELRQLIAEAKCEQVEGETLVSEPPRWEYMTMYLSSRHPPLDDKLNELGNDKWELVAVANSVAYFKRQK